MNYCITPYIRAIPSVYKQDEFVKIILHVETVHI